MAFFLLNLVPGQSSALGMSMRNIFFLFIISFGLLLTACGSSDNSTTAKGGPYAQQPYGSDGWDDEVTWGMALPRITQECASIGQILYGNIPPNIWSTYCSCSYNKIAATGVSYEDFQWDKYRYIAMNYNNLTVCAQSTGLSNYTSGQAPLY